MKWLKRFGIYLIGVALGSLIVSFFWGKKNVSFDYLPNARTLKTIRTKTQLFTQEAEATMRLYNIDSTKINAILKYGEVNFSKSEPRLKPCAKYYVTGKDSLKNINLYIERCDSTATIKKIIVTN